MPSGLRHQLGNYNIEHMYLEFVVSLSFFFLFDKLVMKAWGMALFKARGEQIAKKKNNKKTLNVGGTILNSLYTERVNLYGFCLRLVYGFKERS